MDSVLNRGSMALWTLTGIFYLLLIAFLFLKVNLEQCSVSTNEEYPFSRYFSTMASGSAEAHFDTVAE